MVEQILGRKNAEDIFFSAMLSGMMPEKQASEFLGGTEKDAAVGILNWLKYIGGLASGAGSAAVGTLKAIPPTLFNTALLGASAGGLGAMGYDVLKDRVSQEDPETKYNNEIEALYEGKRRELEDSKWMAKARAMRDELKRGYRKMTTEEYSKKYNALIDLLEEKKEMA